MKDPGISVVIPVRNSQRYLDALLAAVFSQKTTEAFEVLVIDSGSEDRTLDIAGGYPVRIVRIPPGEFNHGLTRDRGVSLSSGEYIIFLSHDAVPADDSWMEQLAGSLRLDAAVAGAYSRQIPYPDSSTLAAVRTERFFTADAIRRVSLMDASGGFEKLTPQEKHRFCNFDNVSSCIRRRTWQEVPFGEADFAEDLRWSLAVLRKGFKIVYEPRSVVYHSHEYSPRQWYRRTRTAFCLRSVLFGQERQGIGQALVNWLGYTLRDMSACCRRKRNVLAWPAYLFLAPLYSLCQAWGQYAGLNAARTSCASSR